MRLYYIIRDMSANFIFRIFVDHDVIQQVATVIVVAIIYKILVVQSRELPM